jgi:hypothetical protein
MKMMMMRMNQFEQEMSRLVERKNDYSIILMKGQNRSILVDPWTSNKYKQL